MADPITSVSPAAARYTPPPYDPDIGDYSSYKPLAKTAWAQNGGGEHSLTFGDFLDVINPLQHLPIISTIYRAITGDKIGLAAKLVGDTLYGGPVAFLASGATAAVESIAGKSADELVAELAHDLFGPSSPANGDAPAAKQEARAHDSEGTHQAELAAMIQAAMAPPASGASAPSTKAAANPAAVTATSATPALGSEAAHEAQLAALIPTTVVPPPPAMPAATAMPEARARDSEATPQARLAALIRTTTPPATIVPPPAIDAAKPAALAPVAAKPEFVGTKGGDEATRRIENSIAEARRAQAGLLLASLQEGDPTPRATHRDDDAKRKEQASAAPAVKPTVAAPPLANPYLPAERPATAANWSNETLAETIARYERAVTANRH